MFSYLGDARVVIGASIGIIKRAPSPLRSTIIGEMSFSFVMAPCAHLVDLLSTDSSA